MTNRVIPMISTVTAVLVNLVFNYILIFGHFGAPVLGIEGAAIATVISRYVELAILLVWTHTHRKKYPFIKGLFTKTTITTRTSTMGERIPIKAKRICRITKTI